MLYIEWCRHDKQMKVITSTGLRMVECDCTVRNEINGWRKLGVPGEVVHAITKDNVLTKVPVMPRPFPVGVWKITGAVVRRDKYRWPYLITTNAWQELDVWELDRYGGYLRNSGQTVFDYQYGLHYSESNTTTGCIKIHDVQDLRWLVGQLKFEQNSTIEVVE